MGTITSGVGLISGLNTTEIINELMAINSEPATLLQAQINELEAQEYAYNELAGLLTTLSNDAQVFATPSNFQATTASSGNPDVLTATTSNGAAVGTYQFQVAQLVSTQQSASAGFANSNSSPVGAGMLTFMEGGGQLTSQNDINTLNGGAGIPAGQFRITDGKGQSAVINTAGAVTLNDIANLINTNTSIEVSASVQDGSLVLDDDSGGNGLLVQNLGNSQTATALGIQGVSGGELVGNNLVYLSTGTQLSQINDGRGVRLGTGGPDLTIQTADGTNVSVSLASDYTIGDVINSINAASGGKVTASLTPGTRGLTLTDNTTGAGTLAVTDANGSHAAEDLGLSAAASGNTITGNDVLAGLGTVLLSSLKGGQGLSNLGTVQFQYTPATGPTQTFSADLSGATSVQDVLDDINAAGGGTFSASLNGSQTGIQITNNFGNPGTLTISDTSGSAASQLGIAGSYSATQTTINGVNLNRQYVTQNSQLSDLNGGQGIASGKILITNSSGNTFTVNLAAAQTLGDVIKDINAQASGVTASIDSTGSGLLLTDTAGGSGKLTVAEDGSSTASDLNILGAATGTTLDGSYTKTLTVTSNDTLQSVATKINGLNAGVSASVINDGSSYRLSITAINSGLDGQVAIDSGTTNLAITNLVNAQDAAVFYGGTGNNQPLLLTSNQNTLSNVIPGVSIQLTGTSSAPVTLTVAQSDSTITTALTQFATDFNSLVDQISSDTAFNDTTDVGGILQGQETVQEVTDQLYQALNSSVSGGGPYKSLADMGLTVSDDQGHISFDANTFSAAFANDPTAVENLFTTATTGLGTTMQNTLQGLTDPISGLLTIQNSTLQNEALDYQDQLTQLDAILADQQSQLETEFANLESTLSNLESQGSTITSLSSSNNTGSSGS